MLAPGPASADLLRRWQAAMLPTYGVPPVALSHGSGARVWDLDGHEYVDLLAGIATSSLGHAHPALVAAVSRQVAALAHTSNLYAHAPAVRLAEALLERLGADGRVFFSNDGATANEAAFKIARRHGWTADPSGGRLEVVATHDGFHGRTMGALAVTGSPAKREPFAPLPGPVAFVPYGDAAAMAAAVTPATAAVFVEPVQGEAGVVVPPAGYLAAVRAACDAAGALLVVDEVQSGIGRTGAWFACTAEGVVPDVLTLAKGLAGGLPLGACLVTGPAAGLLRPGDHGSTFGGNPVSCAAALAVLDTVEREGLLAHVRALGDRWAAAFDAVDDPLLAGHRGVGLWRALQLSEPLAPRVEAAARDAGFLVNAVRPDAVRLAPPLVLAGSDADAFALALPAVLAAARAAADRPAP